MEKPSLCPFCGGVPYLTKTERAGYQDFPDDPDRFAYMMACRFCGAEGPWRKTEAGARRSWEMWMKDNEPMVPDDAGWWWLWDADHLRSVPVHVVKGGDGLVVRVGDDVFGNAIWSRIDGLIDRWGGCCLGMPTDERNTK